MNLRRTFLLSLVSGTLALPLAVRQIAGGAPQNPPPPPGQAAVALPPGERFTALVLLGCKDAAERDWSGEIAIADGQITGLDGWKFFGTDEVTSRAAWSYRSGRERPPAAVVGEVLHWVPYPPGQLEPGGLLVSGRASQGAMLVLGTRQGSFGFRLSELDWGTVLERLDGAVRIVRLPSATPLSAEPRENDFPDIAAAPDGGVWSVWTSFSGGRDELHLAQWRDGFWHAPMPVPGTSGDVWRPRVGVEADGTVWVLWSQQAGGNWDLHAAALRGEAWLPPQRLTTDPGVDFNVRVARGPEGRLRAVWQGVRGGISHIWSIERDPRGDGWSPAVAITEGAGNDWNPAIAVDGAGRAHVVWDTYRNGNYDVYRRTVLAGGRMEPEVAVASSARYEAYPSIAVDASDRIWLAWEEGPVHWGKDRGYTLPSFGAGAAVGENAVIRVAVLDRSGSIQAPAEPPAMALPERERRFLRYPELAVDRTGRPWLAFRHMNQAGVGPGIAGRYYWAAYASSYQDGRWRPAMLLPDSAGRISSFPALAASADAMWIAWNGDGRKYAAITRPGANQVFAAAVKLPALGAAGQPKLVAAGAPDTAVPASVHPSESADVRLLRDYRAEVAGQTYRIVRGDLHRHTELSQDLGGSTDGSLLDFYRYMIDGA